MSNGNITHFSFKTNNKMKNIMGLIDYQSKMIDNYLHTIRNDGSIIDKHVAFELPTGSGKTLIGLLIGEFHRREEIGACARHAGRIL